MGRHPSFEIVQEIGRGPGSVVNRALDTESKRQLAIKELAPQIVRDPVQSGRFWQGAELQRA